MADSLSVGHAFCVSDVHIVHAGDDVALRFRRFLRERVAPASDACLIIVGDLLHFWFGRRGVIPEEFRPLIDALEALPNVVWVEGNHDLRLARALGPQSRIRVVRDGLRVQHAGAHLHLEHGHRVDRSDHGQIALDRVLQTPLADFVSGLITGRGTQKLGLWAATRSSGKGSYDGRDPRWLSAALNHARAGARRGVDLTVLGHGHYLGWWPEGLICLGDWLHWCSYLELRPDGTRSLRRFEPQLLADPPLAESPLEEIPR
jgi:UDP-2,3-diacylglucosamine pyrophosphatase LpxH